MYNFSASDAFPSSKGLDGVCHNSTCYDQLEILLNLVNMKNQCKGDFTVTCLQNNVFWGNGGIHEILVASRRRICYTACVIAHGP